LSSTTYLRCGSASIIWPARKSAHTTVGTVQGELKDRRARTAGTLADQRKKLDDLRRQVQVIPQLENNISTLEAELRYLDAMLAVPPPGKPHKSAVARA
jgi:hypothetical protein